MLRVSRPIDVGASVILEREEHPAIPAGAGDGAGDRRERAVGPSLPFETIGEHRHGVLDTLPLADQPRAGDRHPVRADAACGDVAAVDLLAQRLEPLDRLGLQRAIRQLLDPVGQPVLQEAAVIGRRLGAEEFAPLRLELRRRRRLQRGQARRNADGHAGLRGFGFA